jgi:hypothetical protein
MSEPSNTLTYDQDPPRRPGIDDLGGATKTNDVAHLPDPGDPAAEEYNQICKQVVGLSKVAFRLIVHVTFPSGTPTLSLFSSPGNLVEAGDISFTDHAAGDTSVLLDAEAFPESLFPPLLTLAEDVEIDRARVFSVSGGYRVKTKLGGSGTDCAFVMAFG